MIQRHFVIALFVLALSCLSAQAAQPVLSRESFTAEYAAAVKKLGPSVSVRIVEPMQVEIKHADGGEMTAFLDNAYNEYLRDPTAKDAVIERYVGSIVEAIAPQHLDTSRIVPVVKDRAWVDETQRARVPGGQGMQLVTDDLNSDLVVVYAEDTERNVRYFSPEDLGKAGIERSKLRDVALANLRRILPEMQLHQGEHFSMLTAGADYVPSLLLLDIWDPRQLQVDGDIVIAIPSREVVLLTGSNNRKGIAELRKVARESVRQSTYALTDKLFVYRNGRFEPFGK